MEKKKKIILILFPPLASPGSMATITKIFVLPCIFESGGKASFVLVQTEFWHIIGRVKNFDEDITKI